MENHISLNLVSFFIIWNFLCLGHCSNVLDICCTITDNWTGSKSKIAQKLGQSIESVWKSITMIANSRASAGNSCTWHTRSILKSSVQYCILCIGTEYTRQSNKTFRVLGYNCRGCARVFHRAPAQSSLVVPEVARIVRAVSIV